MVLDSARDFGGDDGDNDAVGDDKPTAHDQGSSPEQCATD